MTIQLSRVSRLSLLFGIWLILSAQYACQLYCRDSGEDVELVSEVAAPNKEITASVYMVSGGGGAGYVYTLVVVRESTDNSIGIDDPVVTIAGACKVDLEWTGDDALMVKRKQSGHEVLVYRRAWNSKSQFVQVVVEGVPASMGELPRR